MDRPLTSIEQVVPYVQEAGKTAYAEQKKGTVERRFKIDGSVVTEIDHQRWMDESPVGDQIVAGPIENVHYLRSLWNK